MIPIATLSPAFDRCSIHHNALPLLYPIHDFPQRPPRQPMQTLLASGPSPTTEKTSPPPLNLSEHFADFGKWRASLLRNLQDYREWLDETGEIDLLQTTRFHELISTISNERLVLALVGEFSRGKSELINALLHTPGLTRLVPSNVGRTTMCPTELMHNVDEEPSMMLLSVETLSQPASIAQLKRDPLMWSRIRLDVNDPASITKAMANLCGTRKMRVLDAATLGLIGASDFADARYDESTTIDVPVWRYAVVNFPHPILSAGLTILDTPGLNTVGQESELTLKTLPGAQAILFMVGADTGLTKSDLDVWSEMAKHSTSERIVVLNKVDTIWDGLKSVEDAKMSLRKLLLDTARGLHLLPNCIFPLSARNAVVGRATGNDRQIRGSGIDALERYIAGNLIARKKQIIARTVTASLGALIQASHAGLVATRKHLSDTVKLLSGSATLEMTAMNIQWQQLSAEKSRFNGALALFRRAKSRLQASRNNLSGQLSQARMDHIWQCALDDIAGTWTTVGLTRGMRRLMHDIKEDFAAIESSAGDMQRALADSFEGLRREFGLQSQAFSRLDLSGSAKDLELLIYKTEEFCADPKNVVFLEKSFMIQRFWQTLVEQSVVVRKNAISDLERWAVGGRRTVTG